MKTKFLIIQIIGKYLMIQTSQYNLNDCVNLPKTWQNRSSSILVNACIVLFTKLDCKTVKAPQLFTNIKLKFGEKYNSIPSKIPNDGFIEKWLV
jgi:hypothetical protein